MCSRKGINMIRKGKLMFILALSVLLVCAPVRVLASSSSLHLYTEKDTESKEKDTAKTSAAAAAKTGDDRQILVLLLTCAAAGGAVLLLVRTREKAQDPIEKD